MFNLPIRPLLMLDAATCAAMGALLIVLPGPIAGVTEIPAGLLFYAGIVLLPIALFMAVVGRSGHPAGWAVNFIVLGNLGWVAASIALPATGMIAPNGLGWALLVVQAAAVAVLASLEWRAGDARRVHA